MTSARHREAHGTATTLEQKMEKMDLDNVIKKSDVAELDNEGAANYNTVDQRKWSAYKDLSESEDKDEAPVVALDLKNRSLQYSAGKKSQLANTTPKHLQRPLRRLERL
ncbi:hypothetical protein EV426DRAFT_707583 [Tirmania nivea]|nr:hypothetical protein EV426DRAFT_707583 [Tirmania nivea]